MRDVVVVGAGPAGLHAASRLAAAGLDVALIEAQAQLGQGAICSGVIGEEAFSRFGLPTSPVLTAILSIQAISPAGKTMEHLGDAPLARVVDKAAFNRALGERAAAAGARIELNQRVESIERNNRHIDLRVRNEKGERRVIKARVALIASGVNGCLNRVLNLARPRQLLRAMQAEVTLPGKEGSAPTRVFVGRSVAPGAFAWEIPLGHGRARVGIMTHEDPRAYFFALLRRIAPGLDGSSVQAGQKAIAQVPVGRSTAERLVAIGEAAGHVKTSTGGGIYYGLLSAEFAAEVVLRAFRQGDFSASRFSDFERYWRSAFGNELLTGYFARELAGSLPDSALERIFDLVNSRKILARLNGLLKFDWHRRALLATLGSLMLARGGNGHG